MTLSFYKYQGTGNDFVVIDDRNGTFDANDHKLIAQLCDRRFGIGADGLMLLRNHTDLDFEMVYFNADGHLGSMCGNGARCMVTFAHDLGVINGSTDFLAVDGPHEADLSPGRVSLKMQDVTTVEKIGDDFFLDTGSPHYVRYVSELDQLDVVEEGRAIRYNDRFKAEGTNVNFLEVKEGKLHIRTYERGVEDETLSCGTGVVASAVTAYLNGLFPQEGPITLVASGGELQVRLLAEAGNNFRDIRLEGPAKRVFAGTVNL